MTLIEKLQEKKNLTTGECTEVIESQCPSEEGFLDSDYCDKFRGYCLKCWCREYKEEKVPVVLDDGAILPNRAHPEDAGADIFSPIDIDVPAHGSVNIDTGVHMSVPKGCAGFVKSKSGLMVRNDIATDGTVDVGYTGAWVIHLQNHSTHDYHISAGDKIAQVVFVQIVTPEFKLVDALEESVRGNGGFGSTGK